MASFICSHLPGYLVAAFIKKLSRLSLTAPPHGLTLILPFIYNLVNRHPNCKALLHRPDGPTGEVDWLLFTHFFEVEKNKQLFTNDIFKGIFFFNENFICELKLL